MLSLLRGRYRARFGETAGDLACAQALRWRAFRAARGCRAGMDGDGFDARCRHVLIEEVATGRLVSCFRLLPLGAGSDISGSYSAQHYGLSGLARFPGRMAELGRLCVDPDIRDPDILRIAFGAATRFVENEGVKLLFGCTSFGGTQPAPYRDVFAILLERHAAPAAWRPQVKSARIVRFRDMEDEGPADRLRGLRRMPPLLRAYLAMGGWVSDHAVIDPDLGTLHVFTGLEVRRVPPGRARHLSALAG